jgi:hypothetical protein
MHSHWHHINFCTRDKQHKNVVFIFLVYFLFNRVAFYITTVQAIEFICLRSFLINFDASLGRISLFDQSQFYTKFWNNSKITFLTCYTLSNTITRQNVTYLLRRQFWTSTYVCLSDTPNDAFNASFLRLVLWLISANCSFNLFYGIPLGT